MSKLKAQAFTGGNLFIEGVGLLGEVVDIELPKLEHETLETSTGIGKYEAVLPTLKPLSVKITVNNLNHLYFAALNTKIPHSFYAKMNATSSDGTDTGVIATFIGKIKNMDGAKFEFNKEANFSFEVSATFYKLEIDRIPAILYDANNHAYIVNGVDMFEAIRKNIL